MDQINHFQWHLYQNYQYENIYYVQEYRDYRAVFTPLSPDYPHTAFDNVHISTFFSRDPSPK